jgi:nucleoside-diphosphate-sugar epimerase
LWQASRNACAFVTGGTGFLGQHLICALREQGVRVRALVRSPRDSAALRNIQSMGVEPVWGDILDLPAVRAGLGDATWVFHLAGRLLVPGVAAREYQRVHVEGTFNLLTACAEAGSVRAIVHCSTTGVLGPTGRAQADETAPLRPSNIYELTKAAGEELALKMAGRHGLPVVVARPGLVYGPGDLHLLGWFRAIQRGHYRVVGRGDNLLHPIYIQDVVDGLQRCAQVPAAVGRAYNLVGVRALPIRELADAIARALARPLPRWRIPLPVAQSLAAVFELAPRVPPARLPLTRSRVRFMTESRAYQGTRARDELGFAPQVDLDAGLQHTVTWYRSKELL